MRDANQTEGVAGASAKSQPATPVRIISDQQDVNKAISKTAAAMRDHVLQPLARNLKGTDYQVDEWQQVEGVGDGLSSSLDRQGVDWMGLRRSGKQGMFSVPIASRVQNLDFWTFTIRRQLPSGADTEWHRLCAPGGNWFLKVPWGRFGDYDGTEFWTEHYPVGPHGQGALL